MAPEVLIYVRTVKTYIQSNEDANQYFLSGLNPDDFYKQIENVSEKNFEKNGDPMLTKDQFENIRMTLKIKSEENKNEKIFFDLNGFGKICLN